MSITLDVSDGDDLALDLYPIFVALVDWSRKAGRTEVSAQRSADAAMRAVGVRPSLRIALIRRYQAGSRATAELDHEGKL